MLSVMSTMVALTLTLVAAPTPAHADGYQRGPDPTTASIAATTGPFAIGQTRLAGNGKFGSAQVYYPTSAADGQFGVVVICPGFVSVWAQMAWLGPRLASQGFVVVGIDTVTPTDQPPQRGDELVAALAASKSLPQLQGIADFSRPALAGWSMGGGGALDAAKKGDYKAVIPIAPFEFGNYATVTEPTLAITGQADVIAPPATMGKQFYNQVQAPKGYLEIAGGSHFFTTSPNTEQAAAMIAFLKRYVDDDTRYTQFLVPGPPAKGNISSYLTSGIS